MIVGITLIIAGILIAVYPPLLSIIVAVIFMLIGLGITSMSYHYKKGQKNSENPFVDFFFRF